MKSLVVVKDHPIELSDDGTWRYLKSEGTAIDKLRSVQQTATRIGMFDGLFERLGLVVLDTNEKITCIHRGDRIDFEEGLEEAAVDLILSISRYQIDRLMDNALADFEDPLSRFRIVREFLAALPHHGGRLFNNSVVTNKTFRKLISSKDLLHVRLVSPDPTQETDALFTLFFVNGVWNVANGLSGKPDRTFRLSPDDALDLLRHGFAAEKAGVIELPKFANWYLKWRNKVEVTAA